MEPSQDAAQILGQMLMRQALDHTVTHVQPDFGHIGAALDREDLDAGSFAMGMLTAGFVLQGLNVIDLALEYRTLVNEFIEKCRAA